MSVDQVLSLLSDYINEYKLIASVGIILSFVFGKRLIVYLVKRRSHKRGEDRRHFINLTKQLINALLFIVLLSFWSSEVQNLAISVAAFLVAIVLATREFIQCLIGFLYYLSSRPFRIGDWIELDDLIGEVVEIDWAKTTILEVHRDNLQFSGKNVFIPNNQLVLKTIKNLNFLKRYKIHRFTITNEPEFNAYELLPALRQKAQAYCADFQEVAARYKSLIERNLDHVFIDTEPHIVMRTNELSKQVLYVTLFCPTERVESLEQEISAYWSQLWFAERHKKQQ